MRRARHLGLSQIWPPVQGSCQTGYVEMVGYEARVDPVSGLSVLTPVVRCVPDTDLKTPPVARPPADCPEGTEPGIRLVLGNDGVWRYEGTCIPIAQNGNGDATVSWLDQELIAGLPNKYLLMGAAAAFLLFSPRG